MPNDQAKESQTTKLRIKFTEKQSKDFDAVDAAKRDVLTIYRNDIFNYAGEIADKVVSIFDQIPPQLSKHEKKFRLSALKPGAKYRDWDEYHTPFEYDC